MILVIEAAFPGVVCSRIMHSVMSSKCCKRGRRGPVQIEPGCLWLFKEPENVHGWAWNHLYFWAFSPPPPVSKYCGVQNDYVLGFIICEIFTVLALQAWVGWGIFTVSPGYPRRANSESQHLEARPELQCWLQSELFTVKNYRTGPFSKKLGNNFELYSSFGAAPLLTIQSERWLVRVIVREPHLNPPVSMMFFWLFPLKQGREAESSYEPGGSDVVRELSCDQPCFRLDCRKR